MTRIRAVLARSPLDPYLALLLAMVGLGILLPARGTAHVAVERVVYLAVAGLFFLYGARLSPRAVWAGLANWRLQLLVLASTFVLFPLVGLAAGRLAQPILAPDAAVGVVFLALLPSTVQSSIAFTSIARGNVPAALCSASASNMIGVVLTPLLAALVFPGRGAMAAGSFADIAMQILAPFVAGQALRPVVGGWLERHPAATAAFDRGSILLIVYSAFSAGAAAGVWRSLSASGLAAIGAVDLAMLGAVIASTMLVSRWLGFSVEDRIAIVFCGSKKSMASGLPMANILFPGHAVGLVVLPLMIFHQLQLFVCATLARRYARRGAPGPFRGPVAEAAG